MKRFLTAAVAAASVMASAAVGLAADWSPPGPIKMLIAFRAGGGADTQARLIAEEIEAKFGWEIIPEEVTGKGGLNAAMALRKEPGDGSAIAMIVTETLGYNLASARAGTPDIVTPITTTAGTEMAIVALSSSGFMTLADVIDAAKSGQEIRFGAMSPALGDLAYVIGKNNGVDFNIISVRGGKAVMDGLNAGDMDIGFGAGIQARAVAAGDMVEIASAKNGALTNSPDAPLLSDFDVPYTNDTMFLLAGPPDMDIAARDAIAAAVAEVLATKGGKAEAFITKGFGGPKIVSGDALAALVQAAFDSAGALMADAQ